MRVSFVAKSIMRASPCSAPPSRRWTSQITMSSATSNSGRMLVSVWPRATSVVSLRRKVFGSKNAAYRRQETVSTRSSPGLSSSQAIARDEHRALEMIHRG